MNCKYLVKQMRKKNKRESRSSSEEDNDHNNDLPISDRTHSAKSYSLVLFHNLIT